MSRARRRRGAHIDGYRPRRCHSCSITDSRVLNKSDIVLFPAVPSKKEAFRLVQINLGNKLFALYQGTTSVVPPPGPKWSGLKSLRENSALSPAGTAENSAPVFSRPSRDCPA